MNLAGWSFSQLVILAFFTLEVTLIALLVLSTYLFRWFYKRQVRKNKKRIYLIKKYLQEQEWDKKPPYAGKNPDLVLRALKKSKISSQSKKKIAAHLLPTLRSCVRNRSWLKRFDLIEGYSYIVEAQDKENLSILIRDEVSVIRLNALRICHKLPLTANYEYILDFLKNLDYATQMMYIVQLKKHRLLFNLLRKKLVTRNLKLKILCYRILAHLKPTPDFFDLALKDIEKGKARVAALRVLALADPVEAKPLLLRLLNHENWEIRVEAVRSLGRLKFLDTVNPIAKSLNDPVRWVRIHAVKALLNLGEPGKTILDDYQINEVSIKTNMAAFFLDIKNIKEMQ